MVHRKDDSLASVPPVPKVHDDLINKSPSRSRTDPTAPPAEHHERSHLHRRLHASGLRNRAFTSHKEHGYRHAAKETVQSAIDLKPPIIFDSLLRRDKKHADTTSNNSENAKQQEAQQRDLDEWAELQARMAQARRATPETIQKVKRDNAKREKELRESLKNIEDIAMNSTRQLDDTYYAILEKTSVLRNTVASLQRLADESRQMHAAFHHDSTQLEEDAKKRLDQVGDFSAQEQAIGALVDQLKSSRQRTQLLNDRLEAARNRVELYEQRERQKRKTNRQRWSAVWLIIGGILASLVVLMIANNRDAVSAGMQKAFDELGRESVEPSPVVHASTSPSQDPLPSLFDEL